jgi:hypothetical protein
MQIYSEEWYNHTTKIAKIIMPQMESIALYKERKEFYNVSSNNELVRKNYVRTIKNEKLKLDGKIYDNFTIPDRNNSANCIVYSLYKYNKNNHHLTISNNDMLLYLVSLRHSIKFIAALAPGILVKFYTSITHGDLATNEMKAIFNEIKNEANVEWYDVRMNSSCDCDLIRVFRLIPLLDECVNCAMLKDADSIMTQIELHNFKKFINDKFAIYCNPIILPVNDGTSIHCVLTNDHAFASIDNFDKYNFAKTHELKNYIFCGLFSSKILLDVTNFCNLMNVLRNNHFYESYAFDEILLNTLLIHCLIVPINENASVYRNNNLICKIPNHILKFKINPEFEKKLMIKYMLQCENEKIQNLDLDKYYHAIIYNDWRFTNAYFMNIKGDELNNSGGKDIILNYL